MVMEVVTIVLVLKCLQVELIPWLWKFQIKSMVWIQTGSDNQYIIKSNQIKLIIIVLVLDLLFFNSII